MPLKFHKPFHDPGPTGRYFTDLSDNQGSGTYDATVYCKGAPFLVHKATQGTVEVDRYHAVRCEKTHSQHRAVGHYHFAQEYGSPAAEAEHFWETVKPHFLTRWPLTTDTRRVDFLILDLETAQGDRQAYIDDFERKIEALTGGRRIIVYCDLSDYETYKYHCRSGKFWLASLGSSTNRMPRCWAHQFTFSANVPGVSVKCDQSVILDGGSIRYWCDK